MHYATFSPDGKRLLTSAKRAAYLWDVQTRRRLATLSQEEWISDAEFSRDARWVVVGSGTTAIVFDAANGRMRGLPMPHQGGVLTAHFSPDGRWLVTSTGSGQVRVWDARTGAALAAAMQHLDQVDSAQFSADGRRVITACDDSKARIWDARTGLLLADPFEHPGPVRSACFSPDGRWILTGCADGAARLWEVPHVVSPAPRCLADLAESVAGQRLNPQRVVTLTSAEELERARRQIEALPGADVYRQWALWMLDNRPDKPISPSAAVTSSEQPR